VLTSQQRPGMLVVPKKLQPIVRRINQNKSVQRVCGLQSSVFLFSIVLLATEY
jgi:hypothetical protein